MRQAKARAWAILPIYLLIWFTLGISTEPLLAANHPHPTLILPVQKRILAVADEILNQYEISYVYGGHHVSSPQDCQACNQCLLAVKPKPQQRLNSCPVCAKCSLDCSHFTQLVYRKSGLSMPYLATPMMLNLSERALSQRFKLVQVNELEEAIPGDLLVYQGHVAILEGIYGNGRGDIVHATGGKDIRRPGEGIQRERNVVLRSFRGPLRRILRHLGVVSALAEVSGPGKKKLRPPPKLKPVVKRQKSDN